MEFPRLGRDSPTGSALNFWFEPWVIRLLRCCTGLAGSGDFDPSFRVGETFGFLNFGFGLRIATMSSKVVYEGWMVRYGRRKIGRSFIHMRYFVLESRLLAYYKRKPQVNQVGLFYLLISSYTEFLGKWLWAGVVVFWGVGLFVHFVWIILDMNGHFCKTLRGVFVCAWLGSDQDTVNRWEL